MKTATQINIEHPADQPVIQPQEEVAAGTDVAQFHTDLHSLVIMPADEETIRRSFREKIIQATGATGVAHVIRDSDGGWDVKPQNATGRIPRRSDFIERLANCCDVARQRQAVHIDSFLGLQSIFAPIPFCGSRSEVMLVLVEESNLPTQYF